jgi:hypothetical protein
MRTVSLPSGRKGNRLRRKARGVGLALRLAIETSERGSRQRRCVRHVRRGKRRHVLVVWSDMAKRLNSKKNWLEWLAARRSQRANRR